MTGFLYAQIYSDDRTTLLYTIFENENKQEAVCSEVHCQAPFHPCFRNPPLAKSSPDFPQASILFSVFGIAFRFNQLQCFPPNVFILYLVVQLPKILDNVVADQSAVFLCDAFSESALKAIHQFFSLPLPCHAYFPKRLHTVPRGDKPLIPCNSKEGVKVLEHPVLWVAHGKVAKDLSRYCPDVVVFVP